jgi:hypothetical protein
MLMQANTDALPLASGRARRPAAAQTDRPRRDPLESDKPEVGREAFRFYNHAGAIVVASAWLVIYAIAAIEPFLASFSQQLR